MWGATFATRQTAASGSFDGFDGRHQRSVDSASGQRCGSDAVIFGRTLFFENAAQEFREPTNL
jgi:hypothetical protein